MNYDTEFKGEKGTVTLFRSVPNGIPHGFEYDFNRTNDSVTYIEGSLTIQCVDVEHVDDCQELVDYEGCDELPRDVIAALKDIGIIVSEDF